MSNSYVREYDRLDVTALTREWHERTCGYWYTVTSGAMAHTAFRTRAELDEWMSARNLSLATQLPNEQGVYGTSRVVGRYRKSLDRDWAEFDALDPILTIEEMDNGEKVPAKVLEDEHGVRTVHLMNVNYRAQANPGLGEEPMSVTLSRKTWSIR